MAITRTVKAYLEKAGIRYAALPHPHTQSSRQTAGITHVPPERLAKAVIFIDEVGPLMVVIPASRHVRLHTLAEKLGRDLLLATEGRMTALFKDCAPGAIPPLGPAYGMETLVDYALVGLPEVFFEAGDHEELIRVKGKDFLSLLKEARYGEFSS
jgi:Ala-tRNA(Pro) deacylase